MNRTITATFDGETLRPDIPLDLEPNARYYITVALEPLPPGTAADEQRTAWDVLAERAGTVEMPADWALEHDHYLYGTPKRGDELPV